MLGKMSLKRLSEMEWGDLRTESRSRNHGNVLIANVGLFDFCMHRLFEEMYFLTLLWEWDPPHTRKSPHAHTGCVEAPDCSPNRRRRRSGNAPPAWWPTRRWGQQKGRGEKNRQIAQEKRILLASIACGERFGDIPDISLFLCNVTHSLTWQPQASHSRPKTNPKSKKNPPIDETDLISLFLVLPQNSEITQTQINFVTKRD